MRFHPVWLGAMLSLFGLACSSSPASSAEQTVSSGINPSGPKAFTLTVAPVWPYDNLPVSPLALAIFQQKVQRIVVLFQPGWSFDSVYGDYPGAERIIFAPIISTLQKSKTGSLLEGPRDKPFSFSGLYSLDSRFASLKTGFYTNQLQMNGGNNDKFIAWSPQGSLVMGYWPSRLLPETALAQRYTLFDHYFVSAFGGTFLNYQFLIAGQAPVFLAAPSNLVAVPPNNQNLTVTDKPVSPNGLVVNGLASVNHPWPPGMTPLSSTLDLVPDQTATTLGDALSAQGVTWAWYQTGWGTALQGHPLPGYSYTREPFQYYSSFADHTAAKALHLKDYQVFLSQIAQNTLPQVCFVDPFPFKTSAQPSLLSIQKFMVDLVKEIQAMPSGASTLIILTSADAGGHWDHAPPPSGDAWGPGTRVPLLMISPYVKKGWVEHRVFDASALLKLIEQRWNIPPLTSRDANANNLLYAFEGS